MNENIDLTKILKDCPMGWKFYSSVTDLISLLVNILKKRMKNKMGCDCCKEVNPADYEKCQQDMERILRNRKPTSSKRYVAPCGESFTFGAKFAMPKRKKKRKR